MLPDPEFQQGRAQLQPACCSSPSCCCCCSFASSTRSRLLWCLVPFPFLQYISPLVALLFVLQTLTTSPDSPGPQLPSLLGLSPCLACRYPTMDPACHLSFLCLPICGSLSVVRESSAFTLMDNITQQRSLTSDNSNTQASFYFSLASSFP